MTTDTGSIAAAAATASGCPYRPDFDPFSESYLTDPFSWLAEARQSTPIFYSPEIDYFVVTKYADVRAILRDPEAFSPTPTTELMTPPYPSTIEEIMKWGRALEYLTGPTLVNEDEPEHMQRRRYITPPFLPPAVAKLESHIREYTNDYLDRIVKRGSADLVDDFVWEIPVRVLFRAMGMPDEDAHYVKQFAAERAVFSWGRPSEEVQRRIAQEVGEFAQFCEKHVARMRENPGEDITSTFIKFNEENPELFSDLMVHSYLINFMFAGHETTTSGSAALFLNLLQNRDQWDAVCQDRSLIPNAVEEALRFNPPLVAWHRRTRKETSVGGLDLPVGARLLVVLASANRDPEVFEEPEKFNIFRKDARKHLAFGFGNHTCLGATIARTEMKIFLEELTRRLPHLDLVPDQTFEFSPNASFRGPRNVLATWDPAANPAATDRP